MMNTQCQAEQQVNSMTQTESSYVLDPELIS